MEIELEVAKALYFQMERLDPEGTAFDNQPASTQDFYRHSVMAFLEGQWRVSSARAESDRSASRCRHRGRASRRLNVYSAPRDAGR